MQIYIHRRSKVRDCCGCGGDARTLDPPQSEAQRRAMYAAAEGRSTLGISKKVGEEFVGKSHDSPDNELKALEKEMKETERKFDAGEISKEKWQEFRRKYVAERHRLTEEMRKGSETSGRLGYRSAGARRTDSRRR